MGTSQSKPNVAQEQVIEKKADNVDCDEQSKRRELESKRWQVDTDKMITRVITGHWKPDLTPNIRIQSGRRLYIQSLKWEDGQKFLDIYVHKSSWPGPKFFPYILVPQGAYKFVAAMDEVIRQLPMEEPTHSEGDEKLLVLATQIVVGDEHYNFELSAWLPEWATRDAPDIEQQEQQPSVKQEHETDTNEKETDDDDDEDEDWPCSNYSDDEDVPEFRQEMVKMLAEQHDGNRRIDKMPKIPEWATSDAPKIEQQEQRPNVEQKQMGTARSKSNVDQEQVTEKKADDVDCNEQSKLDGTKQIAKMPTIPGWATQDVPDIEQQEKQPSVKQEQVTDEKKADDDEQSKMLDLTPENSISIGSDFILYIQCHQWESEQKFLTIYRKKPTQIFSKDLPSILVPQDAYKFVAAMDEVIRQLPMEEPTHPGDNSPLILILATQSVTGAQHYNFKLSAWHPKGGKWNFGIRCVPTSEEHKGHLVYFPLWALPWLRQQMVTILAELDGTKRIDKMPTIPEWATRDAPDIEQQEKQPSVKQEHETDTNEKKADDEDSPCSSDDEDFPWRSSDYKGWPWSSDDEDSPCSSST